MKRKKTVPSGALKGFFGLSIKGSCMFLSAVFLCVSYTFCSVCHDICKNRTFNSVELRFSDLATLLMKRFLSEEGRIERERKTAFLWQSAEFLGSFPSCESCETQMEMKSCTGGPLARSREREFKKINK